MRVRVLKLAQREIDAAAHWYEGREEGLGLQFLDRVDEALDKIGLNPLGFAKVFGENRRCNLERFPYALFFKVREDAIVVGCLHGSRNLRLLRERGSGVIPFPEKPPEPS